MTLSGDGLSALALVLTATAMVWVAGFALPGSMGRRWFVRWRAGGRRGHAVICGDSDLATEIARQQSRAVPVTRVGRPAAGPWLAVDAPDSLDIVALAA